MFRNKVSVSDNLIKEVIEGRTCLAEVANKLKNDKKQKKVAVSHLIEPGHILHTWSPNVIGARNTPKLQMKPMEKQRRTYS